MHLEELAEGHSFLHRADPRVKILIFLFLSFLCAGSKDLKSLFLFFIYSLILLSLTRLKIRSVLSRLFWVNLFIGPIWIFVPLSYQGNLYWDFGPLKISYEGLKYAFLITLKANTLVIATLALLSTSSLFSLAHALDHFKVPKKLITLFFLFYRYLTLLHEEYLKIRRALLSRAFVPKSNLHTYKTYAYLVSVLIIKSYNRSEEIYKAMLCRGFKGHFPLVEHLEIKKEDLLLASISLSALLIIIKIQ